MRKLLHSTFYILYSRREGQSLIEILVALAVGTILIIAAISVIAPALRANTNADRVQVSSALGKELLENVRVFSEADWYNISNLATSSANKYFLVSASSPLIAATGTEGISSNGIASGTVGYWKLDETAGTTAYDFSGNGKNGTYVNTPASTTGKIGGALLFNGTNQNVGSINTSALPSGTSAVSMFAWIKTSTTTRETAVSYGGSATGQAATLNVNEFAANGHFYIDFYGNYLDSGVTVNDGLWHLVGFTLAGSTTSITMYVDGAAYSGTLGGIPNILAGTNMQIGRWVTAGAGDTSPYYFSGSIDEVKIYNRVLSATEVKNIYNAAIYTRYFYLDAVGRDVSDALLSSGGTNDPSTKKLSVVYGWLNGPTSTFSMYLTRFRNNVFDQTDWSGGSGQEGPATTTNSSFSTSTKIYHSTTTGSIIINFQ